MDANSTVENLIGTFLQMDQPQYFKMLVQSSENVIRENHKEIILFLISKKVDEKIISELKEKLKL